MRRQPASINGILLYHSCLLFDGNLMLETMQEARNRELLSVQSIDKATFPSRCQLSMSRATVAIIADIRDAFLFTGFF